MNLEKALAIAMSNTIIEESSDFYKITHGDIVVVYNRKAKHAVIFYETTGVTKSLNKPETKAVLEFIKENVPKAKYTEISSATQED